jgi:hypothetical protein
MYSKTVAPDLALIEAAERASETDAPQDTIVLYGSAAGTSFHMRRSGSASHCVFISSGEGINTTDYDLAKCRWIYTSSK